MASIRKPPHPLPPGSDLGRLDSGHRGGRTAAPRSCFLENLAAATDILVIGFTHRAKSDTRPWSQRLQQDFTPARGFAVYPVAVLAGVPLLFRSFARARSKTESLLTERSRFLVADHDERTWRRVAGYRLPDDPYIVVLDRSGSVLLREAGLFDEQSYEKIAARIRAATRKGS